MLDWAAALIDKPEYRDRKVIFMTHAFLHERSAKRIEKNSYELTPGNTGAEIWRKLIEPSPNIRMVVCGHTGKPGDYEDAVAYRVDKNRAGHDVHQMMFNVQILGGGWEGNGGRRLAAHPRIPARRPDDQGAHLLAPVRHLVAYQTSGAPHRRLRPVRPW